MEGNEFMGYEALCPVGGCGTISFMWKRLSRAGRFPSCGRLEPPTFTRSADKTIIQTQTSIKGEGKVKFLTGLALVVLPIIEMLGGQTVRERYQILHLKLPSATMG